MGIGGSRRKDIYFITDKGTSVMLTFVKSEYRALKKSGLNWIPMNLGGCREDSLMEYIKKNY